MNEYLIIRISNQQQATAPWWVWADNDRQVTQSGELKSWQDLADLADLADGRKTMLLINGMDVLVKQITQPKGSGRHLQKMLPFLIEDDVAQEAESLHLVVLDKQHDQLLIAGVDHDWFRQVWQLCQEVGIKLTKVLPDLFALPALNGLTLLKSENQWLIRGSEHIAQQDPEQTAYTVDQQWFDAVCQTWSAETPVTLFATKDQFTDLSESSQILPNWQHQEIENEQALLSQGLINSPFSLLSGAFKVSGSAGHYWLVWRKAIVASLIFAGIYCSSQLFITYQANQQSQAFHRESERIFRSVFPDLQRIPTVSYLRRQMEDEVARLTGGESSNGVITMFDWISAQLVSINGLKIQRFNYDVQRNEVRLDLQGTDFQQFEAVRKALESQFTVESGPLNRNDNQVLGSITLKQES